MGRFSLRRIPPELRTGSEELQAVKAVYEGAGCYCYLTTQAQRTNATKGLWDMYVLHPLVDGGWWHEGKHGRGVLTEEQVVFGQRLAISRVLHVVGGELDALAFLRSIGIVKTVPVGRGQRTTQEDAGT